nr:transposase [Pseudomonas otitidis]
MPQWSRWLARCDACGSTFRTEPRKAGAIQAKAQVRAKVEHPFRVIKRQFGYVKTRFRGLAKNTAQLVTLFALSNLWMARRHLLTNAGEVRP